ncbi:thymidine kinase [Halocatena halophila]|uniref:thymidine kinase n=1 Tax=Halocatena halophila TaxID=2814576 RepID=UPI002ED1358C
MNAITNGGWIEVITGCMFSGKTEELLRRIRRAEIASQSIDVFTPAIDDRYGTATIDTHTGATWTATVVDDAHPRELLDHVVPDSVVAIDEANFFSNALVEVCEQLANDGHRVIISGTDQTFRGEPFEPLPSLACRAEYVEKLQAVCTQCGDPATRNQRLVGGDPAHYDDPTIVVGAEETYEARCRDCHELRG